jgi:hypothetical protein
MSAPKVNRPSAPPPPSRPAGRAARRRPLADLVNRTWPGFRGDRPLVAVFFVALAMLACLVSAENDTFWQLRAGRDIVATGRVDLIDHYSHTAAGRFWPDHEWLWQAATYLAHAAGGMPLVTAFAAALIVAAVGLAYALTVGPALRRFALIGVGAVLGGSPWSVRPHLFTHAALMVALWAVVRRRLWLLPPLFLLWTNVHGAVVLGAVVLGAALIVAALERDGAGALRLAGVGVLCAAATLVSPLGWRLVSFIGESMERSRVDGILEWQPALAPTVRNVAFWLASGGLIALAARGWRRLPGREDRIIVLAALLFIPLGLRAVRNVAPFALLLAPAVSRLFAARPARAVAPRRAPADADADNGGEPFAHARAVALAGAAAAACVAAAWAIPIEHLNWRPISAEAAAAIRSCPGRLYNQYNDGGPLIWFVPEQPVFIDGRQDPYPLAFLRRVRDLDDDDGERHALFAEHDVHCAALPIDSRLSTRLSTQGWRTLFLDQRWVVLTDR